MAKGRIIDSPTIEKKGVRRWPKYRVSSYISVAGVRYYNVQEKQWYWSAWYHVDRTTSETIEEAVALKTLLENGETLYHIMKPVERCKLLGLQLNP